MNRRDVVDIYNSADALLMQCAAEEREPTDAEVRSLGWPAPAATITARPTSVVRVHREPLTYTPPDARGGPRVSFFSDLLHAQIDGDPECRSRIERHNLEVRAVATTGTSPGVAPPTWLLNEFAAIAHGARPWADTLRRVPIDNANPVNIGTQTAGAVVGAQAAEGDAASDGSFTAATLSTTPKTLTGKVDVSRQLVDGSMPAIDSLIYADCLGAYNEAVETAVVAAFEALPAFAATITYPGTSPVYTNLPDAFIDASTSVIKHRKNGATAVLCSAGAWAFTAKQKDSAGRPLITSGTYGPTNAVGVADATQFDHSAGEVAGLSIVPSWAAVDNHLYVVKVDDMLLLESATFNFRYEEVLGPSSIRLGVWGYAAPVLKRFATSAAKIDAGSTIPAPA